MKEPNVQQILLMTTIRIECRDENGSISTGTGFLLDILGGKEGKACPVLVTNKHVIKGAVFGKLVFPCSLNVDGDDVRDNHVFDIADFQKPWVIHPDPEVDLCAMPISTLYNLMTAINKTPEIKCLSIDMIPDKESLDQLTAIEDVLMIGYPIGLWDSVNNYPIVRKGITATHPGINYEGKKEFLIDAACFPGSSGSPVLLYGMGKKVILLGVLYAIPIHTVNGNIEVMAIPTANIPYTRIGIPTNLGFVISADKLLDIVPIIKKQLQENEG